MFSRPGQRARPLFGGHCFVYRMSRAKVVEWTRVATKSSKLMLKFVMCWHFQEGRQTPRFRIATTAPTKKQFRGPSRYQQIHNYRNKGIFVKIIKLWASEWARYSKFVTKNGENVWQFEEAEQTSRLRIAARVTSLSRQAQPGTQRRLAVPNGVDEVSKYHLAFAGSSMTSANEDSIISSMVLRRVPTRMRRFPALKAHKLFALQTKQIAFWSRTLRIFNDR